LIRLAQEATVTLTPEPNRNWPAQLKSCYLRELRSWMKFFAGKSRQAKRPPHGLMHFSVSPLGGKLLSEAVKRPALVRCVKEQIKTWTQPHPLSLTVQFSLSSAPGK
jgi:hypothetical protein